jgi:GST-like protein
LDGSQRLQELSCSKELGWPYNVIPVNIGKSDPVQAGPFQDKHQQLNPGAGRRRGPDGKPIAIFESSVILMYLAEKAGWRFMPQDTRPVTRYSNG